MGGRIAIQMGGVTDGISLSSESRGTGSTAIQMGGVLQYKLEVYCDTFLRSSGGWGFRHSSEFFWPRWQTTAKLLIYPPPSPK